MTNDEQNSGCLVVLSNVNDSDISITTYKYGHELYRLSKKIFQEEIPKKAEVFIEKMLHELFTLNDPTVKLTTSESYLDDDYDHKVLLFDFNDSSLQFLDSLESFESSGEISFEEFRDRRDKHWVSPTSLPMAASAPGVVETVHNHNVQKLDRIQALGWKRTR